MIYSSLVRRDDLHAYAQAWEQDTGHTWNQNEWFRPFQRSYKGILNVSLI